jgi:hypothetical protein
MTDLYTVRTRLRGAHGEAIDFTSGDRRLRVHFDDAGHGTVEGKARLDAETAAHIRAADPEGAMYLLIAVQSPPPPPPPPVPPKPPAKKGS